MSTKIFRVPLPEQTYAEIRAEAKRAQVPAASLAREAIDLWLQRNSRHNTIVAYAKEMAGSSFDLDFDLEAAGVEHMRRPEGLSKRALPRK
jgi:hypothetical protein